MADAVGHITILNGTATAENGDAVRTLEPGSPVYADDTISTNADSALEITFVDGALLSQGAGSQVRIDEYVFDESNNTGEIAMELVRGTFRSVTGKIVDASPDNFELSTPTATIGIRGTTTGHQIEPGGNETHGILDFDNKPMVVTSRVTGQSLLISQSNIKTTSSLQGLGPLATITMGELAQFQALSPQGLRSQQQEQEQQDEEGQDGQLNGTQEGEGGTEIGSPGTALQNGGPDDPLEHGLLPPGPDGLPLPIPDLIPGNDILPPPPPPIKKEQDNEDEKPTVQTTLDLSDKDVPMTVDLSDEPPYYVEADNLASRTNIPQTIVNVIGATTAPNDITGNDENNRLQGGNQNDNIQGGLGDDTIVASGGDDNLDGGTGDYDYLDYSNFGNKINLVFGTGVDKQVGNDTINEFEGAYGTAHEDTMYGDGGHNTFYGNGSADTLWGAGGNDTLHGGEGNDWFKIHENASAGDEIYGGGGHDKIVVWDGGTYDITQINVVDSVEEIFYQVNGGDLTISKDDNTNSFWNGGIIRGQAGGTAEKLTVNVDADSGGVFDASKLDFQDWDAANELTINSNDDGQNITGYDGKDKIYGNGGQDTLKGGDGNDTLYGGDDKDTLEGGDGDDSLWGGDGNDLLKGGDGIDVIKGEAGNDTMIGSTGNDNFNGGGIEKDTADYSGLAGGITLALYNGEVNKGAAGFDQLNSVEIIKGSNTAADTMDMTGNLDPYEIHGMGGNDVFTLNEDHGDTLYGGAGDDQFTVNGNVATNLEIHGGEGDHDRLIVNNCASMTGMTVMDGIDEIEITSDNPRFTAEAVTGDTFKLFGAASGNQFFEVQLNNTGDTANLAGVSGDTTTWVAGDMVKIVTGNGNDNVTGSATQDWIFSSTGNDVIDLSAGGNDLIQYDSQTHGGDTIKHFAADDQLNFAASEFGSLNTGTLAASRFTKITDPNYGTSGTYTATAGSTDHRFVLYDAGNSTYELYYDSNGSDAGNQVLVATFESSIEIDNTEITIYG